jgi:hypothetical protein
MQTAVKVTSALSSIGSSPMESADSVKGEDTDSLIIKVKSSWLLTICLCGFASASTLA